jgi:hypothetical protein
VDAGANKNLALVLQVKPDPKTIAADLRRFYPGYQPPLCAERDIVIANGAGLRARLVHYPTRMAFLSNVRGAALTNLIGATGWAVDGRPSCNPAQLVLCQATLDLDSSSRMRLV